MIEVYKFIQVQKRNLKCFLYFHYASNFWEPSVLRSYLCYPWLVIGWVSGDLKFTFTSAKQSMSRIENYHALPNFKMHNHLAALDTKKGYIDYSQEAV